VTLKKIVKFVGYKRPANDSRAAPALRNKDWLFETVAF
jgi:hypothetical protein